MSDPALPTDGQNLVMRAAEVLREAASETAGARVHLEKTVPYGAGLGSGSSDAAATLRLLTGVWDLDVPEPDLHRLAATLGSDVPFFLLGRPALATGRGDILTPLVRPDGAPYVSPFWTVVAVPLVHVSTAEAYRLVVPEDGPRPDLAAAVLSDDLDRWRRELVNDFQQPIEQAFPVIGRTRRTLAETGAGYTSMSGSGSAVFGMYERESDARDGAAAAAKAGARVWVDAPAS